MMNAAARIVTGTCNLMCLLQTELHWLDVPQRVQYKLGVMVHQCLQGRVPQYLIDCCIPTPDIEGHQRLRSATRPQLIVPRHRHSRFGCRAFSVAGPMVWNLLPDHLRDPSLSIGSFRAALKTFLFTMHGTRSAVEALYVMRYTSRQSSSSSLCHTGYRHCMPVTVAFRR